MVVLFSYSFIIFSVLSVLNVFPFFPQPSRGLQYGHGLHVFVLFCRVAYKNRAFIPRFAGRRRPARGRRCGAPSLAPLSETRKKRDKREKREKPKKTQKNPKKSGKIRKNPEKSGKIQKSPEKTRNIQKNPKKPRKIKNKRFSAFVTTFYFRKFPKENHNREITLRPL